MRTHERLRAPQRPRGVLLSHSSKFDSSCPKGPSARKNTRQAAGYRPPWGCPTYAEHNDHALFLVISAFTAPSVEGLLDLACF